MGAAPQKGEESTKGWGCTRGGCERESKLKWQREGSSRRVKTKKPRELEDPEGGSPSAYDSMG